MTFGKHLVAILAILLVGSLAYADVFRSYNLDIFYNSEWVGDTSTHIESTTFKGKAAIKIRRRTQITRSLGRIKPMFSELVEYRTDKGDPIELVYTYSNGLEIQEMRVYWLKEKIILERAGYGAQGRYEPSTEEIKLEDAKSIGGSPLDSFLASGLPKKSSVNLSMNFDTKKLEENQFEYVGDATIQFGDKKRVTLEYHVKRGKAVLYKIFVDEITNEPVRIESIDGMRMIPKKAPG